MKNIRSQRSGFRFMLLATVLLSRAVSANRILAVDRILLPAGGQTRIRRKSRRVSGMRDSALPAILIHLGKRQDFRGLAMKSHTEYLWFNTKKQREFINITGEVEKALEKSQIKEGLILVSAMHITAGVYVNDAESGLIGDIEEWLEKLAPFRHDYRHHRTGETNGDAHLKNLLIGHEVVVPVTNGKLDFGPWQQVYYAEFDGQRRKRVLIKVIGE